MKIFLAGAVSSADENQLNKYEVYKQILKEFATQLTTPDNIWEFRQNCITNNPKKTKLQIDKLMTDYDLDCVRNSQLIVCDISVQSIGMGIELGVAHENHVPIVFCYEKGTKVSNMITGSFNKSEFIEYDNLTDLSQKLQKTLKLLKKYNGENDGKK